MSFFFYFKGDIYYDAFGGHYLLDGTYNDGCEEKVKKYKKSEIKGTRKRIGKKKWKKLSWQDRLNYLIEDWGDLDVVQEDNVVVVKGSFGIVYNRRIDKTKEQMEEEERILKKEPWGMTKQEEIEIEKNKAQRYAKGK